MCNTLSFSSLRYAIGRSKVATSLLSYTSIAVLMKIDSTHTVGNVTSPFTAVFHYFFPSDNILPCTVLSYFSFRNIKDPMAFLCFFSDILLLWTGMKVCMLCSFPSLVITVLSPLSWNRLRPGPIMHCAKITLMMCSSILFLWRGVISWSSSLMVNSTAPWLSYPWTLVTTVFVRRCP